MAKEVGVVAAVVVGVVAAAVAGEEGGDFVAVVDEDFVPDT